MKQTKFLVEIHRSGEHNDAIIKMVTNHNEGKIQLTFRTIKGYMEGRYCQYPTIIPDVETTEKNGTTMDISEGNKPTLSLRIIQIEVPEVEKTEVTELDHGTIILEL